MTILLHVSRQSTGLSINLHKEILASKKSPEADFSRQSRKKIANCDIGDRQRDP
jgi:hypothetical protein